MSNEPTVCRSSRLAFKNILSIFIVLLANIWPSLRKPECAPRPPHPKYKTFFAMRNFDDRSPSAYPGCVVFLFLTRNPIPGPVRGRAMATFCCCPNNRISRHQTSDGRIRRCLLLSCLSKFQLTSTALQFSQCSSLLCSRAHLRLWQRERPSLLHPARCRTS